jgi:hypothetical protein
VLAIAFRSLRRADNGPGTPATSLKQSGVIAPINASISCALSARMCSRNAAMLLAEIASLGHFDVGVG